MLIDLPAACSSSTHVPMVFGSWLYGIYPFCCFLLPPGVVGPAWFDDMVVPRQSEEEPIPSVSVCGNRRDKILRASWSVRRLGVSADHDLAVIIRCTCARC